MRSSSVKCVYNIVVFSPVLVFVVINILQENVTMLFIYFSGVALRMIIHPVPKVRHRKNCPQNVPERPFAGGAAPAAKRTIREPGS